MIVMASIVFNEKNLRKKNHLIHHLIIVLKKRILLTIIKKIKFAKLIKNNKNKIITNINNEIINTEKILKNMGIINTQKLRIHWL